MGYKQREYAGQQHERTINLLLRRPLRPSSLVLCPAGSHDRHAVRVSLRWLHGVEDARAVVPGEDETGRAAECDLDERRATVYGGMK